MDRLQGDPVRLLSRDFVIRRGSEELTLIDMMFWQRGEFVLGDERYRFRRVHPLGRSYVLEHDERVVARAERTRLLPVHYRITAADRQLELRPRWPGRSYLLMHGDRIIGEIRRRHLLFSRAFAADFNEALATELEVFVLALVLLRWRARGRAK